MAHSCAHTRRWKSVPSRVIGTSNVVRPPAKYSPSWVATSAKTSSSRRLPGGGATAWAWSSITRWVRWPSRAIRVSGPIGLSTEVTRVGAVDSGMDRLLRGPGGGRVGRGGRRWPRVDRVVGGGPQVLDLSLIHISEPTRQAEISYAVFC